MELVWDDPWVNNEMTQGGSDKRPIPPPLPGNGWTHSIAKWRWILAFVILGGYPMWLGLLSLAVMSDGSESPALGSRWMDVVLRGSEGLITFGLFYWIAWLLVRFNLGEIGGRWANNTKSRMRLFLLSIPRGFGYSLALRFGLGILMMGLFLILHVLGVVNEEDVAGMVPEVDKLVDLQSLANDPVYLVLNLTFVSFIVAGFREELWRALSFHLLQRICPGWTHSNAGRVGMVLFVAIIFGIGHLPQGATGVLLTTILGIGLGLIQLYHRSFWEAVMAHGFFDATSFALIAAFPDLVGAAQNLNLVAP